MERRTQTRCVPVQRSRTRFERLGPPCRTNQKPVETGGVLAGVVDEFAKRFFVSRSSLLLAVSAILKSFTISPPACRAYRLRASSCTSSEKPSRSCSRLLTRAVVTFRTVSGTTISERHRSGRRRKTRAFQKVRHPKESCQSDHLDSPNQPISPCNDVVD